MERCKFVSQSSLWKLLRHETRTSGGSWIAERLGGLEKIRPVCENSEKLINNNNDIQVFFATRRRRNLLAYNNSDKNERKKWENEKPTSCELLYLVCCRDLRSGGGGWEFLQPDTNFRIFGWYIYIIMLAAHKSRKKINTYTRWISKKPQSFYFFFSFCRVYKRFYISYNIYIIIFIYTIAYSFV